MSSALSSRDKYLRQKYGITQEEYEKLLQVYNGTCWACGQPPKEGKNLHVDHDHKTHEVRALLCWPCNQLLRSYATPFRLRGLAEVAEYGTSIVRFNIGHSGSAAPVKRRKKKGK